MKTVFFVLCLALVAYAADLSSLDEKAVNTEKLLDAG